MRNKRDATDLRTTGFIKDMGRKENKNNAPERIDADYLST